MLKKDGTSQMCIDYRALKKITLKNIYPLPRIYDILDHLQQENCFAKLDLKSRYLTRFESKKKIL